MTDAAKRTRAPPRPRGAVACVLLLLLLAAFAGGPGALPASAAEESCNTLPPREATTWLGHHVVFGSGTTEGTPGDDFIVGISRADTIFAGDGNDIVCAQAGDDVIYGGGAGDDLHGQEGNDKVFGQLLDDQLYGGPG